MRQIYIFSGIFFSPNTSQTLQINLSIKPFGDNHNSTALHINHYAQSTQSAVPHLRNPFWINRTAIIIPTARVIAKTPQEGFSVIVSLYIYLYAKVQTTRCVCSFYGFREIAQNYLIQQQNTFAHSIHPNGKPFYERQR